MTTSRNKQAREWARTLTAEEMTPYQRAEVQRVQAKDKAADRVMWWLVLTLLIGVVVWAIWGPR